MALVMVLLSNFLTMDFTLFLEGLILEWLEQRVTLEKVQEWYGALKEQIESLRHFPKRYPLALENGLWGKEEIRQLLFLKYPSTYHVLFMVERDIIQIPNTRHGKRRFLHEKDLF